MSHHKVPDNKKGLRIAIGITAVILLLEFFGGLATNSLALLSDAGHMLSDVSSLVFSLLAMWLAAKPPTADKHYGYSRVEILAALLNGVTLFVIAGLILYEAYHRFLAPEPVSSLQMMVIAVIGLLANLLSAWALLHQGDVKSNINMRSAYLHVLGDALGSVGAIAAGLLMYFWNWYLADPLISVFVAVLILKGAWGVIRQAVHILMEGTPATINSNAYARAICKHDAGSHVFSQACPLLVPLVEEGWFDHPVTRLTLQEYLKPLLVEHIDTLVLGCTHYPLLKPLIRELTGPEIMLIDSAEAMAEMTAELLSGKRIENPSQAEPEYSFHMTDVPYRFQSIGEHFLGRTLSNIEIAKL